VPNYAEKIARIEKKIEQERQRLRDLQVRETAQKRKDDARRKILYGAAVLSLVGGLSEEKRRETLERVHRHIRNAKDREFLGLAKLPDQKSSKARCKPLTRSVDSRDHVSRGH